MLSSAKLRPLHIEDGAVWNLLIGIFQWIFDFPCFKSVRYNHACDSNYPLISWLSFEDSLDEYHDVK